MTATVHHLADYRATTAPTDPGPGDTGKVSPARFTLLDPIDRQCLAWILGLALAALALIYVGEHGGDWLYATAGGAK